MEINNKADLKKACSIRLKVINDEIPADYLSLVLAKDPTIKGTTIINVRHGNTYDLRIVKLLEEVTAEWKLKNEVAE
jgi:hypothetical protein